MTNAEINLDLAVQALESGKLRPVPADFIRDIKDYDKKDLKRLSPKQYRFLSQIADDASDMGFKTGVQR